MNTTKRTVITSMLSGYTMKLVALALIAFGVTAEAQAQLKVSVMPSHTQSASYAKAGLNEAITVWGRTWGGTGAQTYTLDFGDGTAAATGSVTNANYISASHTYTTGGLKTFTLTVTDSTSTSLSRSGVIRVIAGPVHADRVHMAIEKGLLNLYLNSTVVDANQIYWINPLGTGHTTVYGVGATSAAIIAFEENDHLPGEDDVGEIYAETIRRGLNTLFGQATAYTIGTAQHSDGIALRDTDMNDNGRGIYLNASGGHSTYGTPFAGMAIILAKRNSAEALASTVPYGPFAGTNYLTFVQDMADQLHWCQGDGSLRGAYEYSVTTPSQPRWDGSSQQWPSLMLLAAQERLGIQTPQWWLDNAANGFNALQHTDGSIGYSGAGGWRNTAKAGGALALYSFAGKMAGTDANATNARNFIQNYWTANRSWSGDLAGWAGHWYAMWGMKKGLQLQGITTIQTSTGARNWKQDMQAWLLGNATLLDSQGGSISAAYRNTDNMFGQRSDGGWRSIEYPGAGYYTNVVSQLGMDTAHGVLILSEAVTRPVPVAVIAAVGSQSNRAGFRSFEMDGSGSYHLDANSSVIEYLWDWDASNGLNWTTPDASGPRPTNPGYAAVGNYTVTLRVKDNQDPAETATSTVVVNVIDTDIAPVAVAIPASRLPAYSGKVGQPIQLDGTASYDPENDAITLYSWDTDGNGTYGDATGPNPTVTFNTPHVGQIGLRVTANGKTSTNSAVADIYATPNDFYVQSISSSNIVAGVSADVQVVFKNAVGSEGVWNGVAVRFYNGNPLANGVQIGPNYSVNLPSEGTATLNVSLSGLNGVETVYVYIDATKVIPEWDEGNNTASVNVAVVPNVAPSFSIGTAGGNASINGLTVGGTTYFGAGGSSVVVAPDLTYTNSISPTTTGAQASIDNGQTGDVLSWNTAITTANGITGSYNGTTKVLAFSGSASTAIYESLLRSVTYSNAAGTPTTTRTISFNVGLNTLYNPANGHFYEYISSSTTWTNAYTLAAGRTFNGMQGYLATVTSQVENDFIQTKLQADAWIGASDDVSYVNTALGSNVYANQAAVEGKWHWVTGPEAGTQFSQNNGTPSSFSGRYMNWRGGEPNNAGGEHYAEFYVTGGWNDLPNMNLPYVVEYGGLAGDPASTLSLSGSRSVIFKPIVAEDSGAYSGGAAFLSAISPGPANESAQTVSFTVTNNNNPLFSIQPAIDSSGTLTFTPAPNAFGSATVSVTAVDSGGTDNGGSNTSTTKTFVITVTPVDEPNPISSSLGHIVTTAGSPDSAGADDGTDFDGLIRGGYIAENGNFAFPGELTGPGVNATNFKGFWKHDGTSLKRFVRTGDNAPETGAAAAKFSDLPLIPGINDDGQVTLFAQLAPNAASTPPTTADNDTGLWSELGSTGFQILIREDDLIPTQVPPLPANTRVGKFENGCFATAKTGASTGEAAFTLTFKGGSTDAALLRCSVIGTTTTAVSVVALENTAAPGTGETFGFLNSDYTDAVRMDAQGNIVFGAYLKPSLSTSLWYQPVTGGAPVKAMAAGDAAPGTTATFAALDVPAMGSSGTFAFRGVLNLVGDNADNSKNDGIWRGSVAGGFTNILRRGDSNTNRPGLFSGAILAANPSIKAGNIYSGWLTNANRGAWLGWVDLGGDGINAFPIDALGIYTDTSGTGMKLLIASGDPAPGIAGATMANIDHPVVGGVEQVAFISTVTGGGAVAGTSDKGIWRTAANGGAPVLLLRTGDSMTVNPGSGAVSKIIFDLDIPGSNLAEHQWEQRVMDATGKLVIFITFTDGTTSQITAP